MLGHDEHLDDAVAPNGIQVRYFSEERQLGGERGVGAGTVSQGQEVENGGRQRQKAGVVGREAE